MRMKLNIPMSLFLCCLSVLALNACESTEETLGLTKSAPDEFAVVKRAPLALPPDYALRPPRPGAPRPQELEPIHQAKEVVFGAPKTDLIGTPSNPEDMLVRQAGAHQADPDIRQKVDQETSEYVDDNRPTAQKLLDIVNSDDEPPASVLDAEKEAERLRKNTEEGKPITEGETPTL